MSAIDQRTRLGLPRIPTEGSRERLGPQARLRHRAPRSRSRYGGERRTGWFREFFDGQTGLLFDSSDEDSDGDFRAEGVPMADLLAAYAAETALCDAVIAAAPSLDATATEEDGTYSLRWIIVHMIEETGRHLGHTDLLREQADGAVGEGPSVDE